MRVSCTPGEVSSTSRRIGLRRFVTSTSPGRGTKRYQWFRECGIDMCSRRSAGLSAQQSTTCVPCVLTICSRSPPRSGSATPARAGSTVMPSIISPRTVLPSAYWLARPARAIHRVPQVGVGEEEAMTRSAAGLNYRDYLRLETLLACQQCESARHGRPAHDEMLFIIVHQTYELWFKQILFELDQVQGVFAGDAVDDRAIGSVVHGLGRIGEILRLLIQQLAVLETMTPLDFLDFRDLLFPASGSQSLQFRLLETRLGLKVASRLTIEGRPHDANLPPVDREELAEAAEMPSVADQVERWLARTPFIDMGSNSFRDAYRRAVQEMLAGDAAMVRARGGLSKAEQQAELQSLATAKASF